MEIQTLFVCMCNPDFRYSSKTSFQSHYKSNRHILYENKNKQIENSKKIHNLEIDIAKLKRECKIWKEKYLELSLRVETDDVDFLS
jgi:hypothetical protein